MLRFLFFLFTIFIIWYVVNAVLRGIYTVFGGRPQHRAGNEPDEEARGKERTRSTIELRDVKDAEFKDLPPDKPKE